MMAVNHGVVVGWAIFMAGINTAFAHIGLDLNFLFYFMAVCTSGAVFPIGLLMCWKKLNKVGAISGVLGGLVIGFVAWLVTCKTTLGSINTTNLTGSKVILSGSLSALGAGAIISIGLSLVSPADFDFDLTRAIGSVAADVPTSGSNSEKDLQAVDAHLEPALARVEGGGRTIEADAEYAEQVVKLEKGQTRFRLITAGFLLVICESIEGHAWRR